MSKDFDRTNVRKYFKGRRNWISIILFVVGVIMLFVLPIIGVLAILGSIGYNIYKKITAGFEFESDVDKATNFEIEQAKNRGLEKLCLVNEQVSLIEPITTTGMAPAVVTATDDINRKHKSKGFIRRFIARRKRKAELLANQDDPQYFVRIGSDDNLRYTLIHNTVFYFGEHQLYIYWEYVDVATGKIYESGTHEYFYEDIESIATLQESNKQFAPKKKKYVRYVNEFVSVTLAGTSYKAGFRAYTEGSSNNKDIKDRIAAMRNLIRDKKLSQLAKI